MKKRMKLAWPSYETRGLSRLKNTNEIQQVVTHVPPPNIFDGPMLKRLTIIVGCVTFSSARPTPTSPLPTFGIYELMTWWRI